MPSPVLPEEFKEVIPAANSNLCQKLLKSLIEFPVLFYRWFSWAFNADGTISDAFKTEIGITIGQLTEPGGVSASDGTFEDYVRITWNPTPGATFYEVYRGSENDPSSATLLNTVAAPLATFDDSTATDGIVYWYFIKAKTATDSSGFSVGNSGFRDETGGGGSGTTTPRTFTGNGTYTVPAGVTEISVEAWGAGGGGGASECVFCTPVYPFYAGGGGGAGEYLAVSAIPVTAGDELAILVDGGGAGGEVDGNSVSGGTAGGPSMVKKLSAILVLANGGQGGREGKTGSSNGAGGNGGTGGSNSAGVLDTQTAGDDGGDGTTGTSGGSAGTPGAGAAANTGGGNGGGNGAWRADGSNGSRGKIIITPAP